MVERESLVSREDYIGLNITDMFVDLKDGLTVKYAAAPAAAVVPAAESEVKDVKSAEDGKATEDVKTAEDIKAA